MAYDHRVIEARWQGYWEQHETFRAVRREGRPKLYVLDMFPYPSGHGLHVGHPEGYTATDIFTRKKRMQGYDVLHPMGWDAFGLPAEQHAINTGTHPRETTRKNIDHFRAQLKRLGFAYDWSREVNTTDTGYVRWTQWIFLQLFKRGLAFQGEVPVNWCPALGTVLANEEVIDGRSERGGHPVVRQPLRQWQLKITAYAERLAADLEGLDWPETKQKQVDWIGRSEGAEATFRVADQEAELRVYTTRPDTLFGATYVVIAPDHPLTLQLTTEAQRAEVTRYAEVAARKSDLERTALGKEKTGVFTGAYAINPVNDRRVPIYTADYVLGSYGTGAIMAVPAHDQRDFEFAQAFGLEIVQVVDTGHAGELTEALSEPGVAMGSGAFDGLPTEQAKKQITAWLVERGLGEAKVNYRLRDWVFSRQRYWGEPIPIYFPVETEGDPREGAAYTIDYSQPIALDEAELPLTLPELEDYHPGDPQGPLAKALAWRFFQREGRWYARETNTMPQWAGSCWYYLRYLDPNNQEEIFSQAAYDAWMPVDLYMGGAEHAVLHLLYARFWHKVLFDCGVVKHAEPFQKLVHQGMILGQAYRYYVALEEGAGGVKIERPISGLSQELTRDAESGELTFQGAPVEERWVTPAEVRASGGKHLHPTLDVELMLVTEKMAKSRGNVVNPDEVVEEHGADALRAYEMFMGPLEQVKPWQTSGLLGVRRWLDRVHQLSQRGVSEEPADLETSRRVHRTIKKVGEDIDTLHLNTAVSAMMMLTNHLASLPKPPREALEALVLILSPFAPHLAEELWEGLGHAPSVADTAWPSFDPALCEDDVVEVAVQVLGKVRGRVQLAKDASESEATQAALADPAVVRSLAGRALRQVVYRPGKIINLIV